MLLFCPSSDFIDLNIQLEKIKNLPPYKIRRWQDDQGSARGVLVINSFYRGYARGFMKVCESRSLSRATEEARLASKMIESSRYGGACACLVGNIQESNIEETKERFIKAVSNEFNLKLKSNGEFLISNSDASTISSGIYGVVSKFMHGLTWSPYVWRY